LKDCLSGKVTFRNKVAIAADVNWAVDMIRDNTLGKTKIPQSLETVFRPVLFVAGAVAAVIGLSPPATAEQPAPLHADLKKEILSALPNLTLLGTVIEGTLAHRRSMKTPLPISKPGCYVIAAAGENSVEDLSLAVLQSGIEKANDRLSGKKPIVKWCASTGGGVEAEVLMFKGQGAFALAVFEDKAAPADGKQIVNQSSAKLKIGGSDTDFIANRIRQLYPRFGGKRSPMTEVIRGNLKEGAEQQFSIQSKGKCLSIIAAQESSLLKIAVSLSDASQNLPTKKQSATSFFAAETVPCITSTADLVISIRALEGEGRFGLQVFSE
jgi:hypothetical protein